MAIIATLFLPVVGWVRTHICLTERAEGAHKAMVVIKFYVDRSILLGGKQADSCLSCQAYHIENSGAWSVHVGARC